MPRQTKQPTETAQKAKIASTSSPDDFPTHSFPDIPTFESFLSTHHLTLPGLYLKLAKKSSGIPSIAAAEAVEVALCFGWIDGRSNSLDESFWTVRYTPRRSKSLWSAKNVSTALRLIEKGRMRSAGLDAVEAAKRDGRWERAYDGPKGISVPGDLESALNGKGNEDVKAVWEGMGKSKRYAILHRLQVGTRDEKRRGRVIEGVLEALRNGEVDELGSGSGSGSNGKGKGKKVDSEKAFRVEKKTVVKAKKSAVELASKVKVSKVNGEASLSSTGSTRQLRSRKPPQ